jgi:plasmid stabilization system protein ParE
MTHYVLIPEAEADFDDIWMHIATDNMDAATKWIDRLKAEFVTLAQNPGFGHTRDDLTDQSLLFWSVKSYLIIYRNQNPIEIIAVTHGARDIPTFLEKRLSEH